MVAHHLIDIVDPDYNFTAGDFCREAERACSEIFKKEKFPLFVGGAVFYIDAFFKGLSLIPPIDKIIKKQLNLELNERGLYSLYEELLRCDNAFARKIHFNDRQRILRGLEVYRGTGEKLSSYYDSKDAHESIETIYIGIYLERDILWERIERRVDSMMRLGFINEVISLREMGYGASLNSMKSIGYFELNEYLDGNLSLAEAVEKIKTNTKRYAKRQMTWLRRNKRIHWFKGYEEKRIKNLVDNWIEGVLE